mgnify:FL=1
MSSQHYVMIFKESEKCTFQLIYRVVQFWVLRVIQSEVFLNETQQNSALGHRHQETCILFIYKQITKYTRK